MCWKKSARNSSKIRRTAAAVVMRASIRIRWRSKSAAKKCTNTNWHRRWRSRCANCPNVCCAMYSTTVVSVLRLRTIFLQLFDYFVSLVFCLTAKLEKTIAMEMVNNEINVENEVTRKLSLILDNHVTTIQKQKRLVTKLMQDNESAKHKYQVREEKRLPQRAHKRTMMLNVEFCICRPHCVSTKTQQKSINCAKSRRNANQSWRRNVTFGRPKCSN